MTFASARTRRPGETPLWDEDPSTIEDYINEAFMFRDELQPGNRFLATAKLIRGFEERGAAAWRLCQRLREKPIWHKTLGGPYGVEFLLQQLKKEMCPNAIPDIALHIDNYLFCFQRSQHMPMGEYITTDAELYGRMCQALARVGLDPDSDLLESTDWVQKTYDVYQKERDPRATTPYNGRTDRRTTWWTRNTKSRWRRGQGTDAWDSRRRFGKRYRYHMGSCCGGRAK